MPRHGELQGPSLAPLTFDRPALAGKSEIRASKRLSCCAVLLMLLRPPEHPIHRIDLEFLVPAYGRAQCWVSATSIGFQRPTLTPCFRVFPSARKPAVSADNLVHQTLQARWIQDTPLLLRCCQH